jgi:hypothetical protein
LCLSWDCYWEYSWSKEVREIEGEVREYSWSKEVREIEGEVRLKTDAICTSQASIHKKGHECAFRTRRSKEI